MGMAKGNAVGLEAAAKEKDRKNEKRSNVVPFWNKLQKNGSGLVRFKLVEKSGWKERSRKCIKCM